MLRAPINRIIPFSSVDGPGNRTAVFLQGCNWDCRYCHNPETRKQCIGCGACVPGCPQGALTIQKHHTILFNPAACVMCDQCIQVCQHNSSPRICNLTPEETFQLIKKQMPFIRGVTVSGGECCLHPEFLQELFVLCRKAGLNTMIDSNGSIPFSRMPGLLKQVDGVMLDIKAYDAAQHKLVTGAENAAVLENAVFLAKQGKLFEVRTVVVPGLFDAEDTVRRAAALLAPYLKIGAIRYKLIAYRPMGVRKEYQIYKSPAPEELKGLEAIVREQGFSDVIIL